MLHEMVQTPWAAALGWTLVHSLWEGAIAALVLVVVIRTTRSPRVRYAAGGASLLALMGALAFTLARSLPHHTTVATAVFHRMPTAVALTFAPESGYFVTPNPPLYLPWLAPLWMAGVLAFQLRGLAGWIAARRLRRSGVCAAPAGWRVRLEQLAQRSRVSRPVVLLESCLAEVPVVIGYVRPAILIPVGLLAGLPAEQVEAILLHELAHIRRHDYLVNLLQTVVEGLLFYHPAVWWISSVMRTEREHCCDDLVVATQGDAYGYASALAALEERRAVDMQAVLASTGGSLVKRIRRLLAAPEGPRAGLTPVLSAVVLTVTLAGAMAAWTTAPPRPTHAPFVIPRPAPVTTILSPLPTALDARPILIAQAQEPAAQEPQSQVSALDGPYRKWLNEDVAYIISNAERATVKNLQTDKEREQFIEKFWKDRDPTPDTEENEFKEEHYRRIAYANERFASAIPGWKTDRGRIYITFGPPDEIDSHPSGEANATPPNDPFELWRYRFIEGVGKDVVIAFTDPNRNGEYHMTADPTALAINTLPERTQSEFARIVGGGRSGTAPAKSGNATVELMGGNGVRISVPLSQHGSHAVNIYVRITTVDRQMVMSPFEETVTGQLAFSRFLALKPGSYRINIATKDLNTGDATNDLLTIEVK